LARFLTQVAFDVLFLQNGGTYRKPDTSTLSDDDWASFYNSDISPPPPIIVRVVKNVRNISTRRIFSRGSALFS